MGAVTGDPDRLQQVIWNLLSNAIKFTPDGGHVQVRLERIGACAHIVVSDDGQGIDPDFLPYAFDYFRQADSSSTRRHGGLGLGLALVRHIVELHGGTVQADSPGSKQGATFTVRLPCLAVGSETNAPVFAAPVLLNKRPALDGLRVLVVEDNLETLEMLRIVLRHCGAEVKACASVAAGLEILETWEPTILVADLAIPSEDGYRLIHQVRARELERGGRVPAVALTACAGIEDRRHALSAGFDRFVPKPVEPDELATIIISLTNRTERD